MIIRFAIAGPYSPEDLRYDLRAKTDENSEGEFEVVLGQLSEAEVELLRQDVMLPPMPIEE